MKSLIRYGLETIDFAETIWSAVLMLFNMSILPLIVSFTSALNCCITSVTSCVNCCWNVAKSAVVTMSVHNSAGAAAAAAAAAAVLCLASDFFERFHPWRRLTTLRYHVKCNSYLWHDLSQRECVGRMIKCARQPCVKGKKCA